jgi:hypothetical protein
MKAQLLVGSGQVAKEIGDWPDDFSQEEIEHTALEELHHYYEIIGGKLLAKQNLPKPVPYGVRVLNNAGKEVYRCDIRHLALFLGI